jgi:hypothetical protein
LTINLINPAGGLLFKCRLLWFLSFAGPLIANPQVSSPEENTAACVPQAYIANLLPIFQPFAALPESAYEKFDDTGAYYVHVTVLVTIGPDGGATGMEALGGPGPLPIPFGTTSISP